MSQFYASKLKSNHQEIIILCAIICEEQSAVEAN